MRYTIRLFTTSPLSTLIPLQAQMLQAGYRVQPIGMNQIAVQYQANLQPLQVALTDSTDQVTHRTIRQFIEYVGELAGSADQALVLDVLARAQAVVSLHVPADYDHQDETLNAIVDLIAESAEGLFQVDGEGFYDGNELILRMA